MERLFIAGTRETPEVHLDAEKQIFSISGKSIPEDAFAFFHPVHNWINEYITCPNQITELDVKMVYFNTASSKQLIKIFLSLEKINLLNKDAVVNWHYPHDEPSMMATGKRYSELMNVKFKFVETV
ncbi:MAG: DUF1987 domain-containing protein [Bacteroidetes bacterium]|nr:DUF1987 domain-containing protein [Bacteroidota bacterium]